MRYEKIEQVLSNLLSNALKYSSGHVYVATESVADRMVKVTVRDQGRGITAEDVERIFDRFYQVDKQNFKTGFGLGLYISRKIIEMHQDKIWAESTEGEGASFHFMLPTE